MVMVFRFSLLVFVLSGLSACSLFTSDDQVMRIPKSLQNLDDESIEFVEVWSKNIGQGVEGDYSYLEPAIVEKTIFIADAKGTISALDSQTGKEVWTRKLKNVVVGAGVHVNHGIVLLGTLKGDVIALDASNGNDLWKARVSSEVLSVPVTNGFIVVVKSIDDKIAVLDAKSGEILWTQNTLQPVLTLRGSSAPVIVEDAIFAGFSNGEVKAFSPKNGSLLWSVTVSVAKGRSELERMVDIDSTPLIVGDTLFVVSYQGNVAGVDIHTGRIKWSKEVSSYNSLADGFGSLYITDQDSFISSLDQKTGAVAWRQEGMKYRELSAPAAFDSYVAVGDYQGYIHLLSQVDGSILGRYKAGSSAIKAQPQVDENMLYIFNTSGRLMALKKR